ncbi:MAG: SCO family protein [Isosphaeraceae bacterium]
MFATLMIAGCLSFAGPASSPLADIGPAPRTVLMDAAGNSFDLASLKGKVVLVSFVYTTCTGTCPGTTQAMVRVRKTLDEAHLWGGSVAFVSITLDPRRDTADTLRQYARVFRATDPSWHFLTGPPEKVAAVIADWDMWVKELPNGALDHPSRVFLLDPRGHQREIYNLEFLKPDAVLRDVRWLLDESSSPPASRPR